MKHNVPMSSLALAWLWNRGVASPIVGGTKASHLLDATLGLDVVLGEEEMKYHEDSYLPHAITGAIPHK